MGRMWPRRALAAVGLLALAWGSYRAAAGWWYRAELSRAQREVAAGRSGPARERLARLSASWPGEAEVHYELGRLRAGRGASRPGAGGLGTDRARVALRREGGPRPRPSCSGSSTTAASSRPWRASSRWPDAATAPGAVAAEEALVRLLRFEGRFDEVKRLLRDGWARAPDPSRTLRDHLDARCRAGPDRDGPGRPRQGGGPGPRRRPGLARAGEPGDLVGAIRGGGPVAVGLPRASAERPGRLAGPARLGARRRASRRRRGRPSRACRPTGSTRPRSSSCTPGSPASGATARPSASPWNT